MNEVTMNKTMKKEIFSPMFFTKMKSYSRKQFLTDVISGIIVAIIALPLSIALALASGVGPEEGIYTAIFAGFVISFLGGSSVQIAGPTAAFATIVAGIVMRSGMPGLMMATIVAGILLILMGLLRLGTLIKYIPRPITVGFTGGIAVTIVVGQLKDFMGLRFPEGTVAIETTDKLRAVFTSLSTFNFTAVLIGLLCLLILIFWPKVKKIGEKIPGSLIAVLFGVFAVMLLSLNVNTIGDLYQIRSGLPKLTLSGFSFENLLAAIPDGITIALLAAIESLLSCVVADSMIGEKHRSNTELIAQGLGNIASALFGGIPATGAIARTAANIKNGGRSPVSGMVHAVVLLLVLLVLMPYAALIPMPTIAAILFMVAYNMSGWKNFVAIFKEKNLLAIISLVATFLLTVIFNLVIAIVAGLVIYYGGLGIKKLLKK